MLLYLSTHYFGLVTMLRGSLHCSRKFIQGFRKLCSISATTLPEPKAQAKKKFPSEGE